MIPDVLRIGPVPIHLFGILLALAFLAANNVAAREFARKGWNPELASSVVVWAAVGGLVGARLWIVLDDWQSFVRAPLAYLISTGGFVFYGGLFGGALAVTLFFRRHRIPWLRGADAVAPAIVLGQAIGRIGCQLAGDGDWGTVTRLPWGMAYPYAVVCGVPPCACGPAQQCLWPPGVRVHPTPLYECFAYLAIFAVLWRKRLEPAADGTLLAWYLLLSGTARFLVEFVRTNSVTAVGLTQAQLASLAVAAVGGVALLAGRSWRPVAA